MSFIIKVFGMSKLEEEFKKAISIRWCLGIENIWSYSYTFEGTTLNVNDEVSSLVFDFENLVMSVNGSLSLELFNSETLFTVNKVEHGEIISMNISKIGDTSTVIMRIKVNRNSLEFIGTLKNWYSILPQNNSWSFKFLHL